MSRTFLIIQTAFLGDAILSTAVAEKLHASLNDAKIDVLVRKGNEAIFENHPFIRNVLTWEKRNNKYKNLFGLLKNIRQERYDHVINLQRFGASGFITAFSNAKKTFGFNKNPFSFLFSRRVKHVVAAGIHETDRNQSLIASITQGNASKPKIYPAQKHFDSVASLKPGVYVTLSPASVWYTKSFPNYKYIELIQYLKASMNPTIYLLGSSSERDYCEYILKKSEAGNVVNLSGKLTILESAALMKDAMMNYVNDSAPMHIASAMNAPVSAIYCSTIPEFGFGPLSDNSRIIQTQLELDCKPCGLHGYRECPLIHFKCGRSITVDERFLP
jgi:heptosyltransferase-2